MSVKPEVELIFGRPFVKQFAVCYRTVVCQSVTLVYCSQTAGWIKMTLGVEVAFGPSHIVLDEDLAPLPKKGQSPQFSAHFGPCLLWPTAGWIKMTLKFWRN